MYCDLFKWFRITFFVLNIHLPWSDDVNVIPYSFQKWEPTSKWRGGSGRFVSIFFMAEQKKPAEILWKDYFIDITFKF